MREGGRECEWDEGEREGEKLKVSHIEIHLFTFMTSDSISIPSSLHIKMMDNSLI